MPNSCQASIWISISYRNCQDFPGGSVVKNLSTIQELQESQIQSLGQEDPLEEDIATHSSILAWRIPWTEDPGGLQSIGSQRVGHDWSSWARVYTWKLPDTSEEHHIPTVSSGMHFHSLPHWMSSQPHPWRSMIPTNTVDVLARVAPLLTVCRGDGLGWQHQGQRAVWVKTKLRGQVQYISGVTAHTPFRNIPEMCTF